MSIRTITLTLAVIFPLLATSCHKEPKPDVPEGQQMCTYCCSTAHTPCSCIIPKVATCPTPEQTGTFPACAECRQCTEKVDKESQCHSPLEQ